ncbi:hypothetical protein ACFX13_044712 [Malus domestica]
MYGIPNNSGIIWWSQQRFSPNNSGIIWWSQQCFSCYGNIAPVLIQLTTSVTEIQRGKLLDDSKALFAEAYSPTPPFLAPVAS